MLAMDKQHILDEIRRTAEQNGGVALGRARFLQETGIREIDWKGKYWINWSDAVAEAGVKPNVLNPAFDDEKLLRHAAELTREVGHFPQWAEFVFKRNNDKSFPSDKTFRRFGKKAKFALAVWEWCQGKDDWADVVALCEPLMKAAESPVQESAVNDDQMPGYVYLMKSGKYYKIGFTNSLDRRKYEIGMQLPEGIDPIHSIRTDDPSGIEAYWHNRFKNKHMKGEWFNLTAKDVAIFKKRKFM